MWLLAGSSFDFKMLLSVCISLSLSSPFRFVTTTGLPVFVNPWNLSSALVFELYSLYGPLVGVCFGFVFMIFTMSSAAGEIGMEMWRFMGYACVRCEATTAA